jgi:16S rRNA processing protein RimM
MAGPDPTEKSPGAWVWVARIRRPQGRKGEVFAEILTDFPEKFNLRRELWLVEGSSSLKKAALPAGLPRPVELVAHWLHKGGIVLHFAGVDSISAAEALAGLAVAIPRAERQTLDFAAGEAYISDLTGCRLFDVARGEPVRVGEIVDVDRSAGPVPLLMVRGKQGEILIPWAKEYLRLVDTEAKIVEMVLPEGLADLNAPE